MSADIKVYDNGSIVRLEFLTDAAIDFREEYVQYESWQLQGRRILLCDHRPGWHLVNAIMQEGVLSVEIV